MNGLSGIRRQGDANALSDPGRLVDRRAGLRWTHLLLGAALLTPFHVLTVTVLSTLDVLGRGPGSPVALQFAALTLDLPLVAVIGLLPVARTLEGGMARTLCGAGDEIRTTPAATWTARRRTSAWFTLHTVLGGIVGGVSLASPPAGALLLVGPFLGHDGASSELAWERALLAHGWVAVAAGLVLLLLPVPVSYAAGRLMARLAPVLLGPTPAERIADAERRAERMADRARIARELHDSVGHALSAVGIQAAAAARLLHSDPRFAAQALAAIEDTARDAVAELDHVLGLLRDDVETTAPRTLADLPALLDRTRAAGTAVDYAADGLSPARLPGTLSREAYRIVQEGLGNALKHAGDAPVRLRLTVRDDTLEIDMANPVRPRPRTRKGGGSGLDGMRERVALLRGTFEAGPDGAGQWRLSARLPLGAAA